MEPAQKRIRPLGETLNFLIITLDEMRIEPNVLARLRDPPALWLAMHPCYDGSEYRFAFPIQI